MLRSILLAITLLAQGTPALVSDNGTITGVLKTSTGDPAVGVRVSAMAIPESAADAITGAAMASLVATDEVGRFRLENIPPGRYYVVAGRVDFPTYFPGALDMSRGTTITVTAKANITVPEFKLQDSSIRIATDSFNTVAQFLVPVQVHVEGGEKQPVSAYGSYVTMGFTRSDGVQSEAPLNSAMTNAPLPSAVVGAEYRITVNNLPDGYVLKSMTYGSTDLMTDTLKLNAANFLQLGNANTRAAFLATSTAKIDVSLRTVPKRTPPPEGMRITGRAPVFGSWSVYRGDVPGIYYADGTFELSGVPPGRHIVVLQDAGAAPRFYAALVTVGDKDVDGVTLDNTGILPSSATPLATTGPNNQNGNHPLPGLFGRVIEEEGGMPLTHGAITVLGRTMATISIDADGHFTIPHLLPGNYDLRVEAFEHFTLYQTVVIGDEDMHVNFPVRSNQGPPPEPEVTSPQGPDPLPAQ